MILETILALSLAKSPSLQPSLPPAYVGSHLIAKSYSSSRSSFSPPSRSSFSPSRSFSSPSRSLSSPSRSFSSPSRSFSYPTTKPAPVRVSTPSMSAPTVQRIDKQVAPKSASTTTTAAPRVASPVVRAPRNNQPRVVTRETYVERYHGGGIAGNPFFWMWALDNNRNNSQPQQQQPTQVLAQNSDGEQVKVPASQLVVQKSAWNPVREFFVFALGGLAGIVGFFFLANPVVSRR